MKVSEQLRRTIEKAAERASLYRVATDAEVDWDILNRFVTGERPELRSGTIDKLCQHFGMELKPKRRSPRSVRR